MTIEQANAYFASLPEGFAPARQLQEALSAKAGRVDYLGVAGTAGKTTAAALTAAVLRAAGLVTGSYHAGCEPLSARIRVNGEPVAPELLYKWEAWKRLGTLASEMESAALFTVAAARDLRCGAVFSALWNQEREKAGLDQDEVFDTTGAVHVGVEALKLLIAADRERDKR